MSRAPLQLAVVGAGSIGCHHARVISASSRARLKLVVDPQIERARALAKDYGCLFSAGLEEIIGCDAAVVASSTESHLDVALALLNAGLPLLIEKPAALLPADVVQILKESERTQVSVMCGFVERFNPVITTALGILDEAPIHIVGLRHSPAAPHATANAIWDLLVHDIDLCLRFANGAAVLEQHAATWPPQRPAELVDCCLRFDDGLIATLSASRAGQRKVRELRIATPATLIELDLLRQGVAVYRHVRHEQILDGETVYRAETIVDIPFVRHMGEPLALQLDHFLDLVVGLADPVAERGGLLAPHVVAASLDTNK